MYQGGFTTNVLKEWRVAKFVFSARQNYENQLSHLINYGLVEKADKESAQITRHELTEFTHAERKDFLENYCPLAALPADTALTIEKKLAENKMDDISLNPFFLRLIIDEYKLGY